MGNVLIKTGRRVLQASATFTYQTRLHANQNQDLFLSLCASHLSKVERKLFSDFSKGLDIRKLKSIYIKEHGVSARHFNALRINLEGKIASIQALQADYIEDTKASIKKISKSIKWLKKLTSINKKQSFALHQKNRSLARQSLKLARLENDKKNNKVHLCFGSKKLFKKQYALKENDYANHTGWKSDWHNARASQFYLIGSKDETMGNQSCVATLNDDNSLNLRVRVPGALEQQMGKYIIFENVSIAYGKDEVLSAIKSNLTRNELSKKALRIKHGDLYKKHGKAISYRFLKDEKGWRVYITVEKTASLSKTNNETGAIGIDININHLAVTEIDRTGNYVSSFDVATNVYGKSQLQSKAIIGDAVKNIVQYALKKQKPIVLEKLDFSRKKRDLSAASPRQARQLSSFAYSLVIKMLLSRAFRFGVKVHQVNPAYSSVIGRVKFARIYSKLSVHRAAAFVIARRLFSFSERLPHCWNNIPDNTGSHVTLAGLVKITYGHVWRIWSNVLKNLKEVFATQYQMRVQAARSSELTSEYDDIPF